MVRGRQIEEKAAEAKEEESQQEKQERLRSRRPGEEEGTVGSCPVLLMGVAWEVTDEN